MSSISARASARRAWRWRRASPTSPSRWSRSTRSWRRWRPRTRSATTCRAGAGGRLDVAAPARAFAAAGLAPGSAMRVLINPPFNDPARQRASPDRRRRLAHAACARIRSPLGDGGVAAATARHVTLIWRADGLAEVLGAGAGFRSGRWSGRCIRSRRQPAIRVLVRATRAAGRRSRAARPRSQRRGGRPTLEAEAVLRAGSPLPLGES